MIVLNRTWSAHDWNWQVIINNLAEADAKTEANAN